ncbi:SMP-30/gluconolactonase/LRE family protein [Massilia sp. CCM 8733]|uniref:SMP-30/gluconolactonase/LRE family protein n=1 Tax=Massilia mucilaginosa TaxID=2609282 RepID=A0ABX0NWC4_9BURK|nr:SMP-30/gluconolactonase/LRE family protein [Massilia mucilaginosa]NHZ90732.1 SMP-30/gluconolactonase/LRE family protein [Massilia mucilaginosa]
MLWVPVAGTVILASYLGLWPVPIAPVSWDAPAAPGYVGAHAANSKLAGVQRIDLHGEVGPEHVVAGPDGRLYTGVRSGNIVRMQPDGSAQEVFASTGGRPLGMAFAADGSLVVADGIKGLLSVAPNGQVSALGDGQARFLNAVAIAASGKIYVSESSTRFTPARHGGTVEAATLDVMEQSATGRVLEYDPATKALRAVATGFSLANGIALSNDQASLFVSESGRYRVWKIALDADRLDVGKQSPQAQVLFDNLPGYPDNLTRAPDGTLWLGFGGQRNDLDKMARRPFLRSMVLRIPRFLWAAPKPYGHVMAFGEDGKVLDDLQDPGGTSPLTTGATVSAGRLYIHNADGDALGWIAKKIPRRPNLNFA